MTNKGDLTVDVLFLNVDNNSLQGSRFLILFVQMSHCGRQVDARSPTPSDSITRSTVKPGLLLSCEKHLELALTASDSYSFIMSEAII